VALIRRAWVAGSLAVGALVLFAGATPAFAMRAAEFPPGYSGYHDYAETMDDINSVIANHPGIVTKQAIGQSYQGRTIWAVKISDNVDQDENEPEVLFEHLHHAREHITVEQALEIIYLLADNYGTASALGERVTSIVDSREIWIIPMVNPDGSEYDISTGSFQNWRRNLQPIPGSATLGVDLNRNWGYGWGCCRGSSKVPGTTTYRGPSPWFAPEVQVLRDFVLSRRVGGVQQITEAVSWHSFNEQVLWPYGYTRADVPRTMTSDDHSALAAMARAVAQRNGYSALQLSDLYLTDGDATDWLYGDQRIFAFTIEMYPTDNSHVGGFYPPDSVIERETTRNDDAVLWFLEQAGCPYSVVPSLAVTNCGPLYDDFETGRGWTMNAAGTDTATAGRFERAFPARSRDRAGVKQRRYGFSGEDALVTGAALKAGDLDGVTSAQSPLVRLGASGSTGWILDFRYAFAHNKKATAADYLRVLVDGTEIFRVAGNGLNQNAVWTHATVSLDAFAGQSVRLVVEAADAGTDALVEAAVDDLRVYQVP
jgi:hypothetical protein